MFSGHRHTVPPERMTVQSGSIQPPLHAADGDGVRYLRRHSGRFRFQPAAPIRKRSGDYPDAHRRIYVGKHGDPAARLRFDQGEGVDTPLCLASEEVAQPGFAHRKVSRQHREDPEPSVFLYDPVPVGRPHVPCRTSRPAPAGPLHGFRTCVWPVD